MALNRLSVAKLLGTLVAHTQDLSNKKQVSDHYPQFYSDPDYSLNPDPNQAFWRILIRIQIQVFDNQKFKKMPNFFHS